MLSVVQPLNLGDLDIVKKLRKCSMESYLFFEALHFYRVSQVWYFFTWTDSHGKKSQLPKNCHGFFQREICYFVISKSHPLKSWSSPTLRWLKHSESFKQILLDHPQFYLLKKIYVYIYIYIFETTHLQGRPLPVISKVWLHLLGVISYNPRLPIDFRPLPHNSRPY